MSDLIFMMGEFEARFPIDRQYAKNHMWAQPSGDGYRFGFTAYAVRLLQDVYFLEWDVDAPAPLNIQQKIGFIESSKAESDLFSPVAGTLTQINGELLSDPSAINTDKYGDGWLFTMAAEVDELLTPQQYIDHLAAVWETSSSVRTWPVNDA